MKTQYLIIVFVCFFALQAFGQDASLTTSLNWVNNFPLPKKSKVQLPLGADTEGIYFLRITEAKQGELFFQYHLERIDPQLQDCHRFTILSGLGEKKRNYFTSKTIEMKHWKFQDGFLFNKQLIVLASHYDIKKRTFNIYGQKIDKTQLKPESDYQKVHSIHYGRKYSGIISKLKYTTSADGSKLLLFVQNEFAGKLDYCVLDASLNLLSEGSLEIPRKLEIMGYKVSNQGELFLIAKETLYSATPGLQLQLWYKSPTKKDVEQFELPTPKVQFAMLGTGWTPDGHLICIGYYLESYVKGKPPKKRWGPLKYGIGRGERYIKGIFQIEIDPSTKTLIQSHFNELDELDPIDFLGAVGKQRFRYYVTENKASYFIVEKGVRSSKTDAATLQDLVVVKRSPTGEMEWLRTLAKDQTQRKYSMLHISYKAILFEGNLYLLYNEDPYQKGLTKDALPKSKQTNVTRPLVYTGFDAQGNLIPRQKIYDGSPLADVVLMRKIESGKYVVTGGDKKEFKVGWFKMQK